MSHPPISVTARITVWQTLTAAPHRPMFLLGALQGVAVMLWWLADLAGCYGGLPTMSWTLASKILAMASRVSLGHSGRALVADNAT